MSCTPWRAASQCVTGKRIHVLNGKKRLSVKLFFWNVVFTVIVSFYSHIEDTNVSFLVRPFSLLGFSSIYRYLLFVLHFSKPYKSCSLSCGASLIQATQKFKYLLL